MYTLTHLRRTPPPAIRTMLAWSGAVASPFVLVAAALIGSHHQLGTHGLRYALPTLAVLLPAGMLRRAPLPALALLLAGSVAVAAMVRSGDGDYLPDIGYLHVLAVALAVGFIAVNHHRRVSVTAAVLAFAALGGVLALRIDRDLLSRAALPTAAGLIALAVLTAWLIGHSIRQRREFGAALRAQSVTQAITAERLRIARELHDMVAHSIGVIAIQAGVGSRVIDTQPIEARKAMNAIEVTSRETLAGLQRILGALRHVTADPASRESVPGLADLDRLVVSTMRAGVQVDVRWRGRRRPLPADLDLSAFRIIQEAVTNVVRHAGTDRCQVTVDFQEAALHVEVVDAGSGGVVAGGGYGLIGVRERVELLHGQVTAGPRAEGGFRVAARLPIPAGVR